MTTPQAFATPDDFLAHLRELFAAPASSGNPDTEMLARTQADIQALHPEVVYVPEQLRSMSAVGEQLKAAVYGSLSPDVAARVHSNIALGVLDTGEANAAIYKSPDAKYAILLNTGLMQLLNKFVKIIIAWNDPRLVVFCNRKPAEDLTVAELRGYLPELVETYKQFGAPYGAMIKLHPSAAGHQSALLELAELFIVCHELGHFLNGDLDEESSFCAVDGKPWLQRFEENKDHAIEYAADATGFGLLQDVLKTLPVTYTPKHGLQGLISLFNLFYLLSEGESYSHPNPRSRSVNIARLYFGDEFADTLQESYDDPKLLRSLFPQQESQSA